MIEISEQTAQVLLQLCQRSQVPSAQAKILLGQAQIELEAALAHNKSKVDSPDHGRQD